MKTSTFDGTCNNTVHQTTQASNRRHKAKTTRTIRTRLSRMWTRMQKPEKPGGNGQGLMMTIHIGGNDCTGISNYIGDIITSKGGNIEEATGLRLGTRIHGGIYRVSGKPKTLRAIIREIKARKGDIIEGIRIENACAYDCHILVPDFRGLYRGITATFKNHHINIKHQSILIDTPDWQRLGWPDRVGNPEFSRMASLRMRLELNPESEREISDIVEEIRNLDSNKEWRITCTPAI